MHTLRRYTLAWHLHKFQLLVQWWTTWFATLDIWPISVDSNRGFVCESTIVYMVVMCVRACPELTLYGLLLYCPVNGTPNSETWTFYRLIHTHARTPHTLIVYSHSVALNFSALWTGNKIWFRLKALGWFTCTLFSYDIHNWWRIRSEFISRRRILLSLTDNSQCV